MRVFLVNELGSDFYAFAGIKFRTSLSFEYLYRTGCRFTAHPISKDPWIAWFALCISNLKKVSYFECQTKQSSSRVGLNGEISVIGMVSAIQGPTQARCNDWKLIVELISFVDEAIPRFETIKLELWVEL